MRFSVLFTTAFLLSTTFFCPTFGQLPISEWAQSIGSDSQASALAVATDKLGNVYATGTYQGITDFDPGPGVTNLEPIGLGDIFILKMDSDGNLLWAKSIGGVSADAGKSIVVDANLNIYVAGTYQGTADFDPGTGVSNFTSAGGTDCFLLKMDTDGNFNWANSIGGPGAEEGQSVDVDATGLVYLAGSFSGTVDIDPGAGQTQFVSEGFTDFFVQKLDAAGNLLWAYGMGSLAADVANDIHVDPSGAVLVTGHFQLTIDFDPSPGGIEERSASTQSQDLFVQKLDSDGNLIWVYTSEALFQSGITGASVASDASDNVYLTGDFSTIVDFEPGSGMTQLESTGASDIFVLKLDAAGNLAWVNQMGGTFFDSGNSIAIDASNHVYVTGFFFGSADFDPSAGTNNITSFGQSDIFVHKLDESGNVLWTFPIGDFADETGNGIAIDDNDNVVVAGKFRGTADFEPGPGVSNLDSGVEDNIFLLKLSSFPVSVGTISVVPNSFQMGPNPTSGNTYLEIPGVKSIQHISVMDAVGREVYSTNRFANSRVELPLAHLPGGLYLVRIENAYQSITRKLIKQ